MYDWCIYTYIYIYIYIYILYIYIKIYTVHTVINSLRTTGIQYANV